MDRGMGVLMNEGKWEFLIEKMKLSGVFLREPWHEGRREGPCVFLTAGMPCPHTLTGLLFFSTMVRAACSRKP